MRGTILAILVAIGVCLPGVATADAGACAAAWAEANVQRSWHILAPVCRAPAEDGDPISQNAMGFAYYFGAGVPQDSAGAAAWFLKAAEQDWPEAQVMLGLMHSLGHGVPGDDRKAVDWYRRAARLGDAWGQEKLGMSYMSGVGVPWDEVKAHAYLSLALAQGRREAAFFRNTVAAFMTPDELARSERLVRACAAQAYRDCDI